MCTREVAGSSPVYRAVKKNRLRPVFLCAVDDKMCGTHFFGTRSPIELNYERSEVIQPIGVLNS